VNITSAVKTAHLITRLGFAVLFSFAAMTVIAAENSSNADAAPVRVSPRALKIHRSALVFDGHNDFPWELREKGDSSFDKFDIAKLTTNFHTDIPRLRQGGVGAQFFVAYVPAHTQKTSGAARMTLEQIDLIHRMVSRYPETFAFARTADEVERARKDGKIACLIGIEGGHCIENSLGTLRMYHALGARYLTLTHADSVGWADAATDTPQAHGLTDFGRQVVAEMNRLGMLVDISHVSAATMHATLDISKAPVIASHSSTYALAPHPRNVPDDVLRRIKTNNGVVMVNFYSGFVVKESAKTMAGMFEVSRELRAKFPIKEDYSKAMKQWRAEHPMPSGTVQDLVNHIDHIVNVAGIDHVGLGSDYDGVSQVPTQLEDVSSYPVITQELLSRGYSEKAIKKVLGGNILRVMQETERVARRLVD
jgi:membrane dipeptidase